ncbi:MAG: hypothetical protein K6E73_12910 [Bacteroidales bacterium]|nr:hypothetical protein [Bacteroidales bacterium]
MRQPIITFLAALLAGFGSMCLGQTYVRVTADESLASIKAIMTEAQRDRIQDRSRSRLAALMDSSGLLLKMETRKLESIGGKEFKLLAITDLASNQTERGLIISSIERRPQEPYYAVLDSDEIVPCLQLMQYARDSLCGTKPSADTEVKFTARDGVCFGAYCRSNRKTWDIYFYKPTHATEYLSDKQLSRLIEVLEEAKKNIGQ